MTSIVTENLLDPHDGMQCPPKIMAGETLFRSFYLHINNNPLRARPSGQFAVHVKSGCSFLFVN